MAEVPPILVSVKKAASILGDITSWQVYKLLDAGELETRYIGKRRMVTYDSLTEYVERLPTSREASA